MRPILFLVLLSISTWAQVPKPGPKLEIIEYSGVVTAISPGFTFALERLTLDVDGKKESFLFHPEYGEMISGIIKVGDKISIKAAVNAKVRKDLDAMSDEKKLKRWYFFRDRIIAIKPRDEWVTLDKLADEKLISAGFKIFLDQKINQIISLEGTKCGLIFDHGVVGFNSVYYPTFGLLTALKEGDLFSFCGFKTVKKNGYQYPVVGVKEVYSISPLRKAQGKWSSLLFKQNHACIGAKFRTKAGEDVMVSFPSDKAIAVRDFLKPDADLKIYYGQYSDLDKNNLPELHAIIQEKDTLLINDFGFYGGPDVKHEHTDVEFEGKITHLSKSKKGNVQSLIVGGTVFMEIEAMMAQQFGQMLEKGKRITVEGKERVKKIGEIYSKDYRIVIPEKITIDGITFSAYNP